MCQPTVLHWNPVWQGLEQIVLNHVAAAIRRAHVVKNICVTRLVHVHSVGQNKVCAGDNRTCHKETNAGAERNHPKQILTRPYDSFAGLAPQQQLLVLDMTMVSCWQAAIQEMISILQLFNSSRFCLHLCFITLTLHVTYFLGLWFLNIFLSLQTEARLAVQEHLWIFKKARRRRHFWACICLGINNQKITKDIVKKWKRRKLPRKTKGK